MQPGTTSYFLYYLYMAAHRHIETIITERQTNRSSTVKLTLILFYFHWGTNSNCKFGMQACWQKERDSNLNYVNKNEFPKITLEIALTAFKENVKEIHLCFQNWPFSNNCFMNMATKNILALYLGHRDQTDREIN